MNHTIEQYFAEDTTLLNDGFCESMLRSLMVNGRKCLDNPEDYTARAEMMLACTYGCNGILALGNTAWMAEEYKNAAEAAGHQVTLINVAHKHIAGCLACEEQFE